MAQPKEAKALEEVRNAFKVKQEKPAEEVKEQAPRKKFAGYGKPKK